jgi:hypothetical protein
MYIYIAYHYSKRMFGTDNDIELKINPLATNIRAEETILHKIYSFFMKRFYSVPY